MDLGDLQNIVIDEDGNITDDKDAYYRNYSQEAALTVGYLLGVSHTCLYSMIDDYEKYDVIRERLDTNNYAKAIRILNTIRTTIMLRFKHISQTIRISSNNYSPIYKIDFLEADFKKLDKLNIKIITGRQDLDEYLKVINEEIIKRLDYLKPYFPEWLEFKSIRLMFTMPTTDIKAEREKFQSNQSFYPFHMYFNWKNPREIGNILLSDKKLCEIIYENNNQIFYDEGKVTDVSDFVKESIGDFISDNKKVQVFIDGENADPYKFASAFESLRDFEVEKIDKITVYYDTAFPNDAWEYLKHFTYGVEVEAIGVDRIKEDKSLVDHKLVAGVSKAAYRDFVDAFILVSSDSDFWSVVDDTDAEFLVMIEHEKCTPDYKDILRQNGIFYCYLDKFKTSENNRFFKAVLRKSLEFYLNRYFTLGNAKDIFDEAIAGTFAEVTPGERKIIYKKYMEGLKLSINENGEYVLVLPE